MATTTLQALLSEAAQIRSAPKEWHWLLSAAAAKPPSPHLPDARQATSPSTLTFPPLPQSHAPARIAPGPPPRGDHSPAAWYSGRAPGAADPAPLYKRLAALLPPAPLYGSPRGEAEPLLQIGSYGADTAPMGGGRPAASAAARPPAARRGPAPAALRAPGGGGPREEDDDAPALPPPGGGEQDGGLSAIFTAPARAAALQGEEEGDGVFGGGRHMARSGARKERPANSCSSSDDVKPHAKARAADGSRPIFAGLLGCGLLGPGGGHLSAHAAATKAALPPSAALPPLPMSPMATRAATCHRDNPSWWEPFDNGLPSLKFELPEDLPPPSPFPVPTDASRATWPAPKPPPPAAIGGGPCAAPSPPLMWPLPKDGAFRGAGSSAAAHATGGGGIGCLADPLSAAALSVLESLCALGQPAGAAPLLGGNLWAGGSPGGTPHPASEDSAPPLLLPVAASQGDDDARRALSLAGRPHHAAAAAACDDDVAVRERRKGCKRRLDPREIAGDPTDDCLATFGNLVFKRRRKKRRRLWGPDAGMPCMCEQPNCPFGRASKQQL